MPSGTGEGVAGWRPESPVLHANGVESIGYRVFEGWRFAVRSAVYEQNRSGGPDRFCSMFSLSATE